MVGWFRITVRERLAPYNLRPDVLDAAAAMASDQRSDVYVARLVSSTASETVLRMMDGRYAGAMGLFVLTSERILFRPRAAPSPAFSVPLPDVLAIEAATRRVSGTVRVTTPDGSLQWTEFSAPKRYSPGRRRSAANPGQSVTRWRFWPSCALLAKVA